MLQKSNRLVQIVYLVKKLRYKYTKDGQSENQEVLNRIVWHSIPLFYDAEALNKHSEWSQIVRGIEARKKKKHRMNRYFKNMRDLYDQLYFVSLTFTDNALSRISDDTRHRYARTWCKTNCRDYFCNEDFGKINGRPHYHAVVALNRELEHKVLSDIGNRLFYKKMGLDFKDEPIRYGWKYGFCSITPIVTKHESDSDATTDNYKLSGYMLKLTNHAGKIGTGKSFHKRGLPEDIDTIPF